MRGVVPLLTPDGRYLVVRGRLWRRSNPALDAGERDRLVQALMRARRAVRDALRGGNVQALRQARGAVDAAKVALGERGPVWWKDGTPDLNRRMAVDTPYRDWYLQLERISGGDSPADADRRKARLRPRC